MLDVVAFLERQCTVSPLVLCMMFHSNECAPGTSPYNATPGDVEAFFERLETFILRLRDTHDVTAPGLSEITT